MTYEEAPATKLLATHCVFCGKPLLNVPSVEAGAGPVCRKKWLVVDGVSAQVRKEGNRLVHQIACRPWAEEVPAQIAALADLGLHKAAKILAHRVDMITVNAEDQRLYVHIPDSYLPRGGGDWVRWCSRIRGRVWHRKSKQNSFPVIVKHDVWNLMKKCFKGRVGIGPMGGFTI